jgi:hypothetical protein
VGVNDIRPEGVGGPSNRKLERQEKAGKGQRGRWRS